jgi:hypothetical protein
MPTLQQRFQELYVQHGGNEVQPTEADPSAASLASSSPSPSPTHRAVRSTSGDCGCAGKRRTT